MTTDLHSFIAPYALDALDAHERARFEAHLEQCADCQVELAGFLETAVRLGGAAERTPPTSLRDRILAEATTTTQERPVVTALVQRGRLRRTLPRLAMAAAFLVGTVGVGGYVVERGQLSEERSDNQAISAVLASADAQVSAKSFSRGGNVRMISSKAEDAAVILANDLPAPGKGKVYQVWMIAGSGPTSQGTFTRDGKMVMEGVAKADRVAVTVEPEGGSKQPTSPPVASIDV